MNIDHYPTDANDVLTVFRFVSSGEAEIVKLVQLSPINLSAHNIDPGPAAGHMVYNLGFGDQGAGSNPDDKVTSNNGDRDKVLATVAGATYTFCQRYPRCWVYATGSTPTRTRLYQMGLNRFQADVVADFELFGYLGTARKWVHFQKDVNYDAFLIRLK